MMSNNVFGIDLGTNNIKIYSRNDDKVFVEKNMIIHIIKIRYQCVLD